ncbi:helix-turn-helix domain-containing protein [Candidatus Darwinibacter acetoxidans]
MVVLKRHTSDEIAAKLRQADDLAALGHGQRQIARALGVSTMTYHRWRKHCSNPTDRSGEGLLPNNICFS